MDIKDTVSAKERLNLRRKIRLPKFVLWLPLVLIYAGLFQLTNIFGGV